MRDSIWLYALALIIAGASIFYFMGMIEPPPLKRINLACGPKDGAYYQFGKMYQALMAKEGIILNLVETQGSIENLEKITDSNTDLQIAFLQSGVTDSNDKGLSLESLGSLYLEPLWLFHQKEEPLSNLMDLGSKKVSIGKKGSGSHFMAKELLLESGAKNIDYIENDSNEALKKLKTGEIDAAFFIGDRSHFPFIQEALTLDKLNLFSFRRYKAYQNKFNYLGHRTLPEGLISIEKNIPPKDISQLSPTATLVINEKMHEAFIPLWMQIIHKVHRDKSYNSNELSFPNEQYVSYPLHSQAKRYFIKGPSVFFKVLPFWLANLLDRTKIMILPLLTIILPLIKLFPSVQRWFVQRKIYRWYKDLHRIEHEGEDIQERIKIVEEKVARIKVPQAYAKDLYNLRLHIDHLKQKLIT